MYDRCETHTRLSRSADTSAHHLGQVQHVPQHRLPIVILAPHREIKLSDEGVHLEFDLFLAFLRVGGNRGGRTVVEPGGQAGSKVFFQADPLSKSSPSKINDQIV